MSLVSAAHNGNIALVQKLLDEGVDVNIQDNEGYTALILASTYRHIDIVKLLLNSGANTNFQNNVGETALLLASLRGRTDIARLLLTSGANPNLRDNDGFNVLMCGCNTGIRNLLTYHMNIIKIQSKFRGIQIRHKARTQKAYQQISTSLLPIDFDVSCMIGTYLSRMPYDPEVARRMVC